MEKKFFDIVVIGGGTGGYVAAIRAAQRGQNVALIEAKEMGGVCLNRGCIPSKTLIANAEVLKKVRDAEQFGIHVSDVSFDYLKMKLRKDKVIEKLRNSLEKLIVSHKVNILRGFAKFLSPYEIKILGKDEGVIEAGKVIIATGSEPRALPQFPFDYEKIHDSTSLLDITKLPKKIVIIGGGIIGCEFASLHAAFGVDVTIIELLPMIISTEGKNISEVLTAALKKQGVRIETNAAVASIDRQGKGVALRLVDGRSLDADFVLVSVGRKFNTEGIGLQNTGVLLNENGSIAVNAKMETNVPNIYAIGDVTGKWILAHVASHQGIVAADNASGHVSEINYRAVPSVIFTHPEIGTVGYTLEKALKEGYDATLGKFPFQALGKSQATLQTDGFAQIVIDKKTGEILGAQVVGNEASTLIAEMALAIANELTIESVADTIHAHPTLPEAWMEAALLAMDMPIHFPPKMRS